MALLASCGPFGTGSYFRKGISIYTGDGTIRDTSQPTPFFGTRAFRIDLPHFRFDHPFEHTFSLTGVPVINHTPAEIYFEVPSGLTSSEARRTNATIEITILNKNGIVLTHVKGPLNSFIGSGRSIYVIRHSWFQPIEKESYRMQVKFSPGSGRFEGYAHAYIECRIGGL